MVIVLIEKLVLVAIFTLWSHSVPNEHFFGFQVKRIAGSIVKRHVQLARVIDAARRGNIERLEGWTAFTNAGFCAVARISDAVAGYQLSGRKGFLDAKVSGLVSDVFVLAENGAVFVKSVFRGTHSNVAFWAAFEAMRHLKTV
jgi:hypothetical protein